MSSVRKCLKTSTGEPGTSKLGPTYSSNGRIWTEWSLGLHFSGITPMDEESGSRGVGETEVEVTGESRGVGETGGEGMGESRGVGETGGEGMGESRGVGETGGEGMGEFRGVGETGGAGMGEYSSSLSSSLSVSSHSMSSSSSLLPAVIGPSSSYVYSSSSSIHCWSWRVSAVESSNARSTSSVESRALLAGVAPSITI